MFTYLNELKSYKTAKFKITSPAELANIDSVEHALKICTLSIVDSTYEKILNNNESTKVKTNYTLGLDIVRMTQQHIKMLSFVIFR